MLWFKKQPEAKAATGEDVISPVEPAVALDNGHFQQKFSLLRTNAEDAGGVEPLLASLQVKHELFKRALARDQIDQLRVEDIEILLDTVFSARRRLYPVIAAQGHEATVNGIRDLLYGQGALAERMTRFVALAPFDESVDREARKLAGKNRRAAWDFAAELLHFNDPERYPLMSKWVWDQQTQSGAMREFIRGNDTMADLVLGSSPEIFEGGRVWLVSQLAEQGLYRDLPFWVDLLLAQAYTEYFRSMAEGMLSADFGRGMSPGEHVKKFLGIDAPIKDGVLRVRHEQRINENNGKW